jgi:Glycosyltransferase 61
MSDLSLSRTLGIKSRIIAAKGMARLKSITRQTTFIEDVAHRIDEICPAETLSGPAGVCLPGQLDRISAAAFDLDVKTEIAQFSGAPKVTLAARRIELHNVYIDGYSLHCQGRRLCMRTDGQAHVPDTAMIELQNAGLRSSFLGCWFFGHWLRDDCATHELARDFGPVLGIQTPYWPDKVDYLTLFGQEVLTARQAFVSKLVMFDDIHQGRDKALRFQILREKIRRVVTPVHSDHIVYLRRGGSASARSISNEAEVVKALHHRGVIIVSAEQLSIPEMAAKLLGARMIISIEGSQISHALYTLKEGGSVLAIQPPDRFFNSHMDWLRVLDMHYGIVVGQGLGGQFHVDVDELLRTIDLMDAQK